jgi:hypothetical protein
MLTSIKWTYEEVAKLFRYFDMDVEMGPKSRHLLADAGFDNIKVDCFMVTNLDGDPQDFADIIEAGKMSTRVRWRSDGATHQISFADSGKDSRIMSLPLFIPRVMQAGRSGQLPGESHNDGGEITRRDRQD